MEFPLDLCWLHSIDGPSAKASIRQKNHHFQVDEVPGFELSGQGEHLYVRLRKDGQNTGWVKEQMAQKLGVKSQDIGHAGLKERHAVTSQWLSIYAPKTEPSINDLSIESVELMELARHRQKLKPGMHAANRFRVRLADMEADRQETDKILETIKSHGFPNYFGDQRFGHQGGNLPKAWQLLSQRKLSRHKKKSIYLSSLRSFLFNRVLHAYIASGNMASISDGTGPLWGRGRLNLEACQAEFEIDALKPWQDLCNGLEYAGLKQERRDLLVIPEKLSWQWGSAGEGQSWSLQLDFQLPPGAYATSLLRELAKIQDCSFKYA